MPSRVLHINGVPYVYSDKHKVLFRVPYHAPHASVHSRLHKSAYAAQHHHHSRMAASADENLHTLASDMTVVFSAPEMTTGYYVPSGSASGAPNHHSYQVILFANADKGASKNDIAVAVHESSYEKAALRAVYHFYSTKKLAESGKYVEVSVVSNVDLYAPPHHFTVRTLAVDPSKLDIEPLHAVQTPGLGNSEDARKGNEDDEFFKTLQYMVYAHALGATFNKEMNPASAPLASGPGALNTPLNSTPYATVPSTPLSTMQVSPLGTTPFTTPAPAPVSNPAFFHRIYENTVSRALGLKP